MIDYTGIVPAASIGVKTYMYNGIQEDKLLSEVHIGRKERNLYALLCIRHIGLQKSSQVNVLVGKIQFTSYLFPVAVYRSLGNTTQGGYFLGMHAVLYHIAYRYLSRRQRMI
jgi:hypothetical protein